MWISHRRLRADLDRWAAQGWVSTEGTSAIRAELDRRSGPGLAAVLSVLGAVLIGFAAMSFVAANWHGLAKLTRLIVLIGGMWGSYGAAALLRLRGHAALSEAAALAGVAIFGASIMLISQMYHLDGNPPDAVLMWAVGALLAGVLLQARTALALAMALTVLWSGWQTALTPSVHLSFLPLWAAIAVAFYWLRWSPGLHLALAALSYWIVGTGYTLSRPYRHDAVAAIGVLGAVAAAWIGTIKPRLEGLAQVATGYAGVIGFAGLCGLQFMEAGMRAPVQVGMAVLALVLLVGLIAWGWRTASRSLIWLGYAGFSIEILGLYFRTLGSLLGTSLFFLIAGLIVIALAFVAFKLLKQGAALQEAVS